MMKRTGLARARCAAVAALLVALVAGCGQAASSGGAADPGGVLKYGYPMPVAGVHFDPAQTVLAPDGFWMSLVYGTLMKQRSDGSLVPGMAKSADVVDSRTVKITLRPGVKFSDGAAFDAEAVRKSLMRARTPATPAAKGGQDVGMKALASAEAIDPLTVLVRLNAPLAGEFLTEMSQRDGAIVSPKQIAGSPESIDSKPVGAGPFTLVENVAHQRLSFRKNPGYWDAGAVKLGGVDIVNTPTGPQQVNGLLSGALDWASYVPVNGSDALSSSGQYATNVNAVYTVELVMCAGKAPFDNESFRQAVQAGIDRKAYAQRVFGGKTMPAYGLFREDSKNFAPELKNLVAYDQNRAKTLVGSIGATGASFDLHYPATLDFGSAAEALQAQLRAIGLNAKIVADRDSAAAFINPKAPGALLFATIGSVGYGAFARHFSPGSLLAVCGVDRPDVMQAADRAAGLSPNDPNAVAAYRQAEETVARHAYVVPIVGYPTIAGWNTSRVGGTPAFNALGFPQLESLYVKGR